MVAVTRPTTASSAQRNRGRPVAMKGQVPTIQNIQKTVEFPQVQFIDKDTGDVSVVWQRRLLVIRKVQKSVEARQVLSLVGN